MIPILHTNLEFGPSFSHSSFPKVFIIILKLCPYLATRYILYRKIDGLSVHLFSLPVATHGFMCGLQRAEDHGTNLRFKNRSQQFPKNSPYFSMESVVLETFL